MRMAIDDTGHEVLAAGVDNFRIRRRLQILADGRDLSTTDQHVGVLQSAVRDRQHGRIANQSLRRIGTLLLLRSRAFQTEPAKCGGEQDRESQPFHVSAPVSF